MEKVCPPCLFPSVTHIPWFGVVAEASALTPLPPFTQAGYPKPEQGRAFALVSSVFLRDVDYWLLWDGWSTTDRGVRSGALPRYARIIHGVWNITTYLPTIAPSLGKRGCLRPLGPRHVAMTGSIYSATDLPAPFSVWSRIHAFVRPFASSPAILGLSLGKTIPEKVFKRLLSRIKERTLAR